MEAGRFITFEGGEGAGKSTQATRLCAVLRNHDLDVLCTREPGGSPGAEDIRRLLVSGDPERWEAMSEALLHYAARHDHLTKTVRPALARGTWVVSDRFADSTFAYQGCAHGLGVEKVVRLHELVVGAFAPDLTLILDLPVELGLARARERGGDDRYERMDLEFHRRLREGYLAIARRAPERCVVVDAAGSPDSVAATVLRAVRDRLGLTGDGC